MRLEIKFAQKCLLVVATLIAGVSISKSSSATLLDCWLAMTDSMNPPESVAVRMVVRIDWTRGTDLSPQEKRARASDIRLEIENLVNNRAATLHSRHQIEVDFLNGDLLAIDFPTPESYQKFFRSQRFYESYRQLLVDFPIEVHESRAKGNMFGEPPVRREAAPVEAAVAAPFVVGGKNSSASIANLKDINGIAISTLETQMRPGGLSETGFLGSNESLVEVLTKDNVTVVERLGLTHQEIANHLEFFENYYQTTYKMDSIVEYRGRRYHFKVYQTKGMQQSPFQDGTWASAHWRITNIDSFQSMEGSFLHIPMIRNYGFYEGAVPFRLAPEAIVKVFDFLDVKSSE